MENVMKLKSPSSFVLLLLFVFMSGFSYAQSAVRVMRIHCNDGAVSELPLSLIDSITFDYSTGNYVGPTVSDSITSNEVLERAYKMATLQWTPLKQVPKRGGGFYPAGVTVTGVPYSEVKEINTYLFQDVSYHTFMTALHSPLSVVYTIDISQPPYHGTYCATYYGAVCSSSVFWALGLDIPYYTYDLESLSDFSVNEHQEIDSLRVCDVIWKTGHVQMIYDMEYRDDTLYQIMTFETSGEKAHFNYYTPEQFLIMWNTYGYVGYRYNKLKCSTQPAIFQEWDPIIFNDALCPSKGDKSVYRSTDTVTIHIYDSNYDQIILTKGATLVASENYSGDMHQYQNLQPGIYNVFLQGGGGRTASVSFEVVDVNVSCSLSDDGTQITIYFESSAKPAYAALSKISGYSHYYPLSDIDRWRGYITLPRPTNPAYCFCKVIFKGEYGSVINVPISIDLSNK